jgi:hypothetical protein
MQALHVGLYRPGALRVATDRIYPEQLLKHVPDRCIAD